MYMFFDLMIWRCTGDWKMDEKLLIVLKEPNVYADEIGDYMVFDLRIWWCIDDWKIVFVCNPDR